MVTEAMQITSTGPQTIQSAAGTTVKLGCTYTPAAADTGPLDIEWSNVSPDMTQKDKVVCVMTERNYRKTEEILPLGSVSWKT